MNLYIGNIGIDIDIVISIVIGTVGIVIGTDIGIVPRDWMG